MKASDLKPAGQLAQQFGVKLLVFGPPGTGKTPTTSTAPRPVLCATEPGLRSMQGSTVPTWEAYDSARISEFFEWFAKSNETKNFDTFAIDSISNLAEIILTEELIKNKHGMGAYGELAKIVKKWIDLLYYKKECHIYLIAKQELKEDSGIIWKKPYFPGQVLNVYVPHLFDEYFHVSPINFSTIPKPVVCYRTRLTYDISCRDRSGNLDEYEQTDLTYIFNKCSKAR